MIDKLLLTVPEAAKLLSLGKTFVYELVARGEIDSIKLGKARRIPVSALEKFVNGRREQQCAAG